MEGTQEPTNMRLTLLAPALLCTTLAQGQVRFTEYMYKGSGGEFFELTNMGATPVDMTGWSYDDSDALPGNVDLSPLGTLAPGESAVVTETNAGLFELDWGLAGVKIMGDLSMGNLSRNDTLYLFDAALGVHDVLNYGDEDYPGSKRADGESLWVCDEALGTNFIWSWRKSDNGDAQGSVFSLNGDEGSPGSHLALPCDTYRYCTPAALNSTGFPALQWASGSFDVADNELTLTATQLPLNQFGYFLCSQTQSLAQPPGSQGNLCLGGTIGRFNKDVQNSGAVGAFSIQVDLTQLPVSPPVAVQPGETWNFSAWYRDINPTPTSNFTDAVAVMFE